MRYNYKFFLTLNSGEQSLVKWQFQEHGGFYTSLWDAIRKADLGNLERLEKAFPLEVKAYRRFAGEEGYWENILSKLRNEEVVK